MLALALVKTKLKILCTLSSFTEERTAVFWAFHISNSTESTFFTETSVTPDFKLWVQMSCTPNLCLCSTTVSISASQLHKFHVCILGTDISGSQQLGEVYSHFTSWSNPILCTKCSCNIKTTHVYGVIYSKAFRTVNKTGPYSSCWEFTPSATSPSYHIPSAHAPAFQQSSITSFPHTRYMFYFPFAIFSMQFASKSLILNLSSRNIKRNMSTLGKDVDVVNIKEWKT